MKPTMAPSSSVSRWGRVGLVLCAALLLDAAIGRHAQAMQLASGSYVGNGATGRAITGVGFQPDAVIIKGNDAHLTVMRTATMTGDAAKELAVATRLQSSRVRSLDADGFTVGTHAEVNGSGVTYVWTAFKDDGAGDFRVGSYVGTGRDNLLIGGLRFQPSYVIVMPDRNERAVQRSSAMVGDYSLMFDGTGPKPNYIQALQADGFQVGTDARVNASGATYHYVAWKAAPGTMSVGAYTGNDTDNHSIASIGFRPDYVIVKASVNEPAVHRAAPMVGDSTLSFSASTNLADAIQALEPDGFQVGTANTVNGVNTTYFWMAFRSSSGTSVPALAIDSVNGGSDPAAGTGFPVVVRLRDAGGVSRNVTTATAVKLSLKTGSGALGGTLTGTIPVGESQVTISGVTYTKAEGNVRLTASGTSGDVLAAGDSTPFTVNPGPIANYAVVLSSPQPAGGSFGVTVTAKDQFGNPVTTDSSTLVTLGSASGHVMFDSNLDGTFSDPTKALTAGVLSLNAKASVAETTTVAATDANGKTGSVSLTVTAGKASALAFTTQPGNATAGTPIPGPPTVAVQDAFGNTIVSSTAKITLALGANPSGGAVAGTKSKNASRGIATFDDLSISKPGDAFTLIASGSGLTRATSDTFTVSAVPGALSGTVAAANNGHPLGGAKVEAIRTGLVKASVTTNADGTYSIGGLAPGSYDVRASAAGYESGTQPITVDAGSTTRVNFSLASIPVLAIRITNPATGSAVNQPWIVVQGEISGSRGACAVTLTMSIPIQGEPTDVAVPVEVNGTRFAARVSLTPGDVRLVAYVTDRAGQVAQDAVTVTFQPDDPDDDRRILPDVTPTVGFAPLSVTFGGDAAADPSITLLDLDVDGDGQPEFNLADFAPPPNRVTYTYQKEGLYIATMMVGDQAGRSSIMQTPINVIPVPDLLTIWDGFRAALGFGDTDGAAEFVGMEARNRYREAFESLGTADLASIAANLGAITVQTVTPTYATAATVRTHDGVSEGFVVHFVRDGDGIWRIVSM